MNLILLHPTDFQHGNTIVIRDHRLKHVLEIHRAQVGDTLCVGELNGNIGLGKILELDKSQLKMEVQFNETPPPVLPATLILALPRPRVFRRTLINATTMGVKRIHFIHTNRVEKSYWHSPVLEPEKVHECLILGLEQAKDTLLPEVHFHKRFRPFVEDVLPELSEHTRKIVAHPGHAARQFERSATATTLCIGPEGGFVPFEIEKLRQLGFEHLSIGQRILKVETAVPVLLATLFELP